MKSPAPALDFRNAGLDAVPREVFDQADTLEQLDLSGNRLTSLPDEFVRLRSLRRLFLSNNPIEEFPRVLGQLPQLEMVGLKSCRLRRVAEDALPTRLRWLILTDNQLESLPASLGARPRLQKLALAGNRLSALPSSLAQASSLELLRVSANQLKEFPRQLLQLPRLSWLAFAGNPFCTRPDVVAEPILWAELELHEVLGSGASGVISRATHRVSGEVVAVKVFKGAVTSDGLPEDEVRTTLLAGTHANLVAPLGRVVDHPQGADALVLSLMPSNFRALGAPPDFESCTRDVMPRDLGLSAAQFQRVVRGVASVAAHLHARGVSHGDLYAHNTRVDADGNVLIGDFGAASVLTGLEEDVRAGVEKMEVRALGAMVDDLLTCGAPDELRELRDACWSRSPPRLSSFQMRNEPSRSP
jgi:hypothetical protein